MFPRSLVGWLVKPEHKLDIHSPALASWIRIPNYGPIWQISNPKPKANIDPPWIGFDIQLLVGYGRFYPQKFDLNIGFEPWPLSPNIRYRNGVKTRGVDIDAWTAPRGILSISSKVDNDRRRKIFWAAVVYSLSQIWENICLRDPQLDHCTASV